MFYQRGDVSPKKDPVSTLNWPYSSSAKAVYATQTVLFVNLT